MKIVIAAFASVVTFVGMSGCRILPSTNSSPTTKASPIAGSNSGDRDDSSSLFADDKSSLSDKELQELISAQSLVPGDARLAVLRAPSSTLRGTSANKDLAKQDELLNDELAAGLKSNKRITSITTMPSMLVPSPLTVAAAREAGARFQVNLLLVFRPTAQVFDTDKNADVTGLCKVAGAVVDTKNGTIPFALTVTEDFQAKRAGADTAQNVAKAELEAARKALSKLGQQAAKFLDTIP